MATPAFAGYLIKRIDETRCPQEYNLSEGEEGNFYTVYVLLEPFKTEEAGVYNLPPNIDSELRKFWGESLKGNARSQIENNENCPFSTVEYQEIGDSGFLVIHGTTLEKIRNDQYLAERNRRSSYLEKLMLYPNNAMKEELNRRDVFRARASEICFQTYRQRDR